VNKETNWLTNFKELSPSWETATCAPLQDFPAFYGLQRFIITSTRVFHWSLSWARSIQFISLRSILILLSYQCLGLSFYFFYYWWGGTKSLGTVATSDLLYKPQMIDEDDCGAIGGIKIGRGKQSTRRKPAPVPLCPPQNPRWPDPGSNLGLPRWEASD
jgi:hypothetical protein